MRDNPIVPTIDLAAEGVQHGFLRLPYSRDDSAWGSVMIPLTVVKNGKGPTALLTGANHGDEYEGPLALQELALTLDPAGRRWPRHHRAIHELSRIPRRPPQLADRPRQSQPLLPRPPRRHA